MAGKEVLIFMDSTINPRMDLLFPGQVIYKVLTMARQSATGIHISGCKIHAFSNHIDKNGIF